MSDDLAREHKRLAQEKAQELRERGEHKAAAKADEYAEAWAKEQR